MRVVPVSLAVCVCSLAGSCTAPRQVRFESWPPGAAVFLDGRPIGRAPVETRIAFPYGSPRSKDVMRMRAVTMDLEGYERASWFISIKDASQKKGTSTVRRRLEPLTFTYRLRLTSTPSGATILIDGEDVELTTPCLIEREFVRECRFERPRITLRMPGYEDKWLDIDPGKLMDDGSLEQYVVLTPAEE